MRLPRTAWLVVSVVILVAVALAGWLTVRAVQARHRVETAQRWAQQVEQALLAGDPGTARRRLVDVQRELDSARHATSGPAWWLAAHLPYAGRTPRVIRGVVDALDRTADDVLPALVRAGTLFDPVKVHLIGATMPLNGLNAGREPLAEALRGLVGVRRELAALPGSGVIPSVAAARATVLDRVDRLTASVATAALIPDMLGAQGPRRYLLALQNNAEARGTGGVMGVWGILTADQGRLSLARMGSIEQLPDAGGSQPRLGAGFAALYGSDPGLWRNANESPDFPYAARLWLTMWRRHSPLPLDGVIATDPVAMSYLLRVTGPVRMRDGTRVSATNVVSLVERRAYERFQVRAERKAWLVELARAVFGLLGHDAVDTHALVSALGRGVREHRLLLYSAHPAEQRRLATTPIGGLLPVTEKPFVSMVVNNASGNKLDYYLHRRLDYVLGPCRGGMRRSTVTVELANDVPPGRLPSYVRTRRDAGSSAMTGSNRLLVYFFLTSGAGLQSASVDGRPISVVAGSERGHLALELPLDFSRGQTRRVVLNLREPAHTGRPAVWVQPLVVPQMTRVHETSCSGG